MAAFSGLFHCRPVGHATPLASARRAVVVSRSTDANGRGASRWIWLASSLRRPNGFRMAADSSHGARAVAVSSRRPPRSVGADRGTVRSLGDDHALRLMGLHAVWTVCPPCGCGRIGSLIGSPLAFGTAARACASNVSLGTGCFGRQTTRA